MGNALSTTCSMKSLIFSGVLIWEWRKRSSYLESSVKLRAGLKKFATKRDRETGGLWILICLANQAGPLKLDYLALTLLRHSGASHYCGLACSGLFQQHPSFPQSGRTTLSALVSQGYTFGRAALKSDLPHFRC